MRLSRARDFDRVFREGIRSQDAALTVLARPNRLSHPRLGLAIARKHVPAAVGRNRVKRLIRESFRLHQDLLRGLDVVVLARRGLGRPPGHELAASLSRHWTHLSERCKGS